MDGERPEMRSDVSQDLKTLIQSCRDQNPDEPHSAAEMLTRSDKISLTNFLTIIRTLSIQLRKCLGYQNVEKHKESGVLSYFKEEMQMFVFFAEMFVNRRINHALSFGML
jgi:hypothetical protein